MKTESIAFAIPNNLSNYCGCIEHCHGDDAPAKYRTWSPDGVSFFDTFRVALAHVEDSIRDRHPDMNWSWHSAGFVHCLENGVDLDMILNPVSN